MRAYRNADRFASAAQLDKLDKIAERQSALRIDASKLQGLDGPGCARLRDALFSLRSAGKEVVLTGEAKLIALLEQVCQPGKVETDGAAWALLLEVFRLLGLKERFEETAVNYAVTYEVSPPSWETPPALAAEPPSGSEPSESEDSAYRLSGEVTGASEALAKACRTGPRRTTSWLSTCRMPFGSISSRRA